MIKALGRKWLIFGVLAAIAAFPAVSFAAEAVKRCFPGCGCC